MAASTDPDELPTVLAEQRRELMAAQALDSDLDLAFRLQMEEAIAASLSLNPAPSTPPPPATLQENDDVFNFASLQTEELAKFEQTTEDHKRSLAEFNRMRDDLHRRIHDQKVAADILRIPEEEWAEDGDNYERPYGEGSSSAGNVNSDEIFRVYFKGLMSLESVRDRSVMLSGIGVAICDSKDNVIFEMRKPLIGNGTSRQGAEVRALIEGLHTALALDLKRIVFFVDYYPLFKFVTGRWPVKQRKIATLVNQVSLLQKKFTYCNPSLVARNDIKFAFKLARDAIVSQITGPAESSGGKNLESCVICLEDTDVDKMFSVDGCQHQYCFSCMKQHVEVKLLHGMVPKCPHDGCKTELKVDRCGKFLTPKLIEIMNQRIKEASIPVMEKLYCPYPRCSALMSKSEVLVSTTNAFVRAERGGAGKCTNCQKLFCIYCKVPWHDKMTCNEYKRSNPYPRPEDAKLKSLATMNLWRQCVKCNHMIELLEGCYHMTCRCGYEFCYTCGAEWKNKKATCSCPLWDEENILYDEDDDDFDEDEEDEEEGEEFYDSDSDYYY